MNIYQNKFSQDIKFYVYEYLRSNKSKYGNIGTPYYVGKGHGNRAYTKHDWIQVPKDKNNIKISQLMNELDAFKEEIKRIQIYGRIDLETGCLRNKTNGGDGASGVIRSEQYKKKMSVACKGKFVSEKTKQKQSEWRTGKTYEELYGLEKATILKQQKSNNRMGKPRSIEIRKKISDSHKGKILTEEHKKNISLSKQNISDETRKKMSLSKKGISVNAGIKKSKESIAQMVATRKANGSYNQNRGKDGKFIKINNP